MRRRVLVYFILFFLATSFFGGSVFTTYTQFIAEGPCPEKREVVIPKGSTLKQVASLLKKENLIHSISVFELGVRASGKASKLQAGEFSFPPYSSSKMIMNILTDGSNYIRKISIPEGWTVREVIEYLNSLPTLQGDIFIWPEEGSLLPETYYYAYGDTRQSLIDRMQNSMKRAVDEAWENRQKGLPISTKKEAIILASIIEKETSVESERFKIASVFVNRLNKKMRLQSDPTVIYALTLGKEKFNRSLTYKDLRFDSPYNTYVTHGLPPGAISNPGINSIKAALNPERTSFYYFVADGTGGHTFSSTYAQHHKKVLNWRTLRKSKNKTKN